MAKASKEKASKSTIRHGTQYKIPEDLNRKLCEAKIVLEAVRNLPISDRLKRHVVRWILWGVAFAGGNTQGGYFGRFRSEVVRTTVGEDIQRHHVHGMALIIQKVLDKEVPLDEVIASAQCIVVVTRSEHDALHAVESKFPGWERFGVAKVIVNDMVYDEPRRITEFP